MDAKRTMKKLCCTSLKVPYACCISEYYAGNSCCTPCKCSHNLNNPHLEMNGKEGTQEYKQEKRTFCGSQIDAWPARWVRDVSPWVLCHPSAPLHFLPQLTLRALSSSFLYVFYPHVLTSVENACINHYHFIKLRIAQQRINESDCVVSLFY